ncbi:MAG: hypothetical protein K2W99_02140 [Chthoniobacterales bacterium]|nr:hypothetical protein [Chthoniobacterales bacterium]
MMINKFLFVIGTVTALVACQPNKPKATSENGTYQCINANITIAGKPTTVLIEWNSQTGTARLLDSAIFTSKTTGAQNVILGWVPLGELNQVIQEVLQRDQQQQKMTAPAPALLPSTPAPALTPSLSVETHVVKPSK